MSKVIALRERSIAQDVDRLGELERKSCVIAAEMEEIKSTLKRRGAGEYAGTKYRAVIKERTHTRIDVQAAKAMLTEAELRKCMVSVSSLACSIRRAQ